MTHRERVAAALRHRAPDRIPVDLGGMDSTGITGIAYNRLKKHLGIAGGRTQVYDPFQQVAKVEPSVLAAVGADVMPIITEPKRWRKGVLPDGSECELPAAWEPATEADGSEAVRDGRGIVRARRPSGGYYFEPVNPPLAAATSVREVEQNLECIRAFDQPAYCDETLDDLAGRARALHDTTDFALLANFAVHIFAAGQLLRGFEQFLVDLVAEPAIAECIMEHLALTFIERFDRYRRAVGSYAQIVNVNDDLGTQENLQISPALYRKMVKPYHAMLYRHIKQSSSLFLFLHTDGSVYDVIPDLIELGVDVLNPVQFTARNMELGRLKREFGRDICFWGGGCDTQNVLAHGTPEQVRAHVRACCSSLAPDGGFVFNQVHNIQPDVPPENIAAMYEAVSGG